ncbi:MAG TPA: hypothetical protein VMW56_23880, partial [Candidatus Margulisiibacteriota bacterium]|nr:hypothetical protein [Candidatus Margulisiibacteriota bacterium]
KDDRTVVLLCRCCVGGHRRLLRSNGREAAVKEGLRRATYGDVSDLGAYIGQTLAYLVTTEDHREGALSFVERRPPVFKGR